MYSFVIDKIVPFKEASLHVSDLSIQRGFGVFDFLKVKGDHPFFINDYLQRFFQSAEHLRLEVPLSKEAIKSIVSELIKKNSLEESGIKLLLTGGYSEDGYQPGKPNLIILQQPLTLPSKQILETGVKIITHDYVREIPHAKTINYTTGIILLKRVSAENAYDVLYHRDGVVSEFPRSNFFIVTNDNVLRTPMRNILKGVTRKNILQVASGTLRVEEGDVTLSDVFNASEAFLSSTTKRVLPIVNINGNIIGSGRPGVVTLDLYNKLVALELADERASKH